MLKKKTSLTPNQYILNIDLLQKYKLQHINKIPKIKETTLSLDLGDFLNKSNTSEDILQIHSFFMLYSFSLILPSVQIYKNLNAALASKSFKLKLTLKNSADIEGFLQQIFLYLIEKEEDILKLKYIKSESNLGVFIPLTENLSTNLNKKSSVDLHISFLFNKKEMKKNNFFIQFPPFWVFKLNG